MLARTLDRAAEIGLPATLLPMWYDVDEPEDFLRLQAELGGRAACPGGPARHTSALLAGWAGARRPADSAAP